MKSLGNYLFFNGNCRTAMQFYQKVLGGELSLFTAGEGDPEIFGKMPKDLVLNARLNHPALSFMASDNSNGDTSVGDNVVLYLDCTSREEVDRIYAAMSEGGEREMPPEDHFWGAYMGSLTDQFGVSWMINWDAPGSN